MDIQHVGKSSCSQQWMAMNLTVLQPQNLCLVGANGCSYLLQSGILSSLPSGRKGVPVRLCGSTIGRWIGLSSKTQRILTQIKSICTHANIERAGNWKLKNYCYFGSCEHVKKPDAIWLWIRRQSWKADEAARLIPSPGLVGEIATMPERLSQQHGW